MKSTPGDAQLRRRQQAHPDDIWHLDEVVATVSGRKFCLWRTVDPGGVILEEILQSKREKCAARRLLKSLIVRFGLPKRIVTDKPRSHGAAKREVVPGLAAESGGPL